MTVNISNEYFSKNIIEALKKDALDKGFTENFFFDFELMKYDLPFDFDKDKFIECFKEAFLIPRFNFSDFDYKIRFSGYISRIKAKYEYTFSFGPSEELIRGLRNLPNSPNF